MKWTKPEMKDVCLCMEVTAYINTDDAKSTIPKTDVKSETRGHATPTRAVKAVAG